MLSIILSRGKRRGPLGRTRIGEMPELMKTGSPVFKILRCVKVMWLRCLSKIHIRTVVSKLTKKLAPQNCCSNPRHDCHVETFFPSAQRRQILCRLTEQTEVIPRVTVRLPVISAILISLLKWSFASAFKAFEAAVPKRLAVVTVPFLWEKPAHSCWWWCTSCWRLDLSCDPGCAVDWKQILSLRALKLRRLYQEEP